jgi:hypothetical protein
MCFQCSRFRQYTRAGTAICEAFPRKIPDEIFFQAGDHRLKFRDEDLLFEAENLVALDLVEEFWGHDDLDGSGLWLRRHRRGLLGGGRSSDAPSVDGPCPWP